MPIFIDLVGKPVLIVGAGKVALRRARQLLAAGARVTVVAPTAAAEFHTLAGIELLERAVQIEDVSTAYRLVVVATDNDDVNAMISDECSDLGILCNRCDDFTEGSFVCGSTLQRGPLTCATMAGGVPEIAKYINSRIEGLLRPGLITLAELLVELRPAIKAARPGQTRDIIAGLVNDETIARIEREGIAKLREEIMACL
jgi:uroporphyrin-III C-methyltransferase/precorrin-2 dehydrogenase/sirohydrochlorin ferrochelatase